MKINGIEQVNIGTEEEPYWVEKPEDYYTKVGYLSESEIVERFGKLLSEKDKKKLENFREKQ